MNIYIFIIYNSDWGPVCSLHRKHNNSQLWGQLDVQRGSVVLLLGQREPEGRLWSLPGTLQWQRLSPWVSLNESHSMNWNGREGGGFKCWSSEALLWVSYIFSQSLWCFFVWFMMHAWQFKKGLLTGKLGQRRWGTKHYISVLWQFLFSSLETNCIIRQRQTVCLQSYYLLFESDHNFLSH